MASDNLVKRWARQLLFDVPRFRTNAKSRRRVLIQLLAIALVCVAWGAYVGVFALMEYKSAGGWGVLWCAGLYGLAFSIRQGMKKRGNAITLHLGSTPAPHLRQRVLNERLMLAIVVARGASEASLRAGAGGEAKPGARAALNQRLRREGLWDSLPAELSELLAAPEGTWSEVQISGALLYVEAVRVLNWALREDCGLASLRMSQTAQAEVLEIVFEEPDPARAVNFLRSRVELEGEEGPARVYFSRLTSELVRRGASEGERDEGLDDHAEQYMAYASSVGEADIMADDLPVGGMLVRETETDVLLRMRGIAAVRLVTLEGVREVVERQSVAGLEKLIGGLLTK